MFIFTLDYWDSELFVRKAEIRAQNEKEAQDKLRQITRAQYIKTISIKEEPDVRTKG